MHERTGRMGLGWIVCSLGLAAAALTVSWQESAYSATIEMTEAQPQPVMEPSAGPRGRRGGSPVVAEGQLSPPPGSTPNPAQPTPGGEKKEGQPAGEKKEEKPAEVQRPEAPPKEADPKELDVILNDSGLVPAFNFQGQPWPAVLQWYSKLANCSLDWQELPNGYVNVFTQRSYPLDDVRNLLNRYLLARGYTMLQRDRVVSIFKLENLDPSLVELVPEIELFSRKPFDVLKVAFQLPKSMDVTKAKEDVKAVLNPKAKVMAFVLTKQLLVIDACANLQTVSSMLNDERAKEEGKTPLKEFVLKHRRAEEVIDILYVTLGLDPKSKPSQMELQVQQQKLQIMQQMAQRGTDVAAMLKKDGPAVFLSYNRQKNSVIANAPEEQMKMIEDTLKMLDVPIGGAAPSKDVTAEKVIDRTFKTTTFKLKTLNPQSFATTLAEIGGLDPFTVLKADSAARSIFVQGIGADHVRIKELIDELDGEERFFKMIQLGRYPAEEAATTIRELIAGKREVKEESSQDSYYRALANMYSSSSRSSNDRPKDDSHEGFYVTADVVNNRLLVKANKLELELITKLLQELGEVQTERKDGVAMRIMEQPGADILEKLRKAWGQTENNPLVIDGTTKSAAKSDEKTEDSEAEKKKPQATTPAKDRGVQTEGPVSTVTVLAHFASQVDDEPAAEAKAAEKTADAAETKASTSAPKEAEPTPKPATTAAGSQPAVEQPNKNGVPPVSITVTDDGRLVIRSTDPDAVDRMETLISELTPAPKRVKVFPLKHQYAGDVCYNLKLVFEDEMKEEAQTIRDWYGQMQKTSGRESGTGLSKRPKMIIDYDIRTNSIFVSNASASQLREIEELVVEFDKEPPAGKVRARRNATIKVNYSKASIIAAALKEVYIDLLTTRDREFDQGDGKRQTTASSFSKYLTDIRFGEKAEGGEDKATRLGLAFNGELSIGVDDVSNNILISCQEELFEGVVDMIHKLDQESAPKMSIVVQPLSGTYKAADLQKTMTDAVGRPWLGNRPEDQQGGAGGRGGGAGGAPQGEGGGQQNNNPQRGGARGARGR